MQYLSALFFACLIGPVSAAASAEPEEHFAPPVGTELDYHGTSTITGNGGERRVSEIDQHRVVMANDDLNARFSFETTYLTPPTPGSSIPVPSPDNFFAYRMYSLHEMSSTLKMPDGDTKHLVLTYDCDKAGLQSLLPLGHIPRVMVSCSITNSMSPSGAPNIVEMTISYEGRSKATTPAGTFSVANIKTNWQDRQWEVEGLMKIDTAQGLLVSSETKVSGPTFSNTTISELVKVK